MGVAALSCTSRGSRLTDVLVSVSASASRALTTNASLLSLLLLILTSTNATSSPTAKAPFFVAIPRRSLASPSLSSSSSSYYYLLTSSLTKILGGRSILPLSSYCRSGRFPVPPPFVVRGAEVAATMTKTTTMGRERDEDTHESIVSDAFFIVNRRAAMVRAATAATTTATAAVTLLPFPASAKSQKEPITPEAVTDAFNAVRYELSDPNGGVAQLESLIRDENYAAIMDFTRTYDLEFRKAKMGRARKLLSDPKAKDDALAASNAVTFDLIGMNKNSRPGKESKEGIEKYLDELKMDVAKFLDLEKTVDFGS